MSIQPWQVIDYVWCASCNARVVNPDDTVCTMCAAHMRLQVLDLEDDRG